MIFCRIILWLLILVPTLVLFLYTSGVKGVYWNKQKNKFQVQIEVKNRMIYLGRFKNIQEATIARKLAEQKYFGDFI